MYHYWKVTVILEAPQVIRIPHDQRTSTRHTSVPDSSLSNTQPGTAGQFVTK
jgi:hypothetical protein